MNFPRPRAGSNQRSKDMKTIANRRLNFHLLLTAICGATLAAAVAAESPAPAAAAATQNAANAPTYLSSSLQEVVKLTKAGVSDAVVLNYVQASRTAYSLDAQDIIQLRAEGVSTEVTTALIRQGEAVRKAEAAKATEVAATAPAVATPTPVVVTAPALTYVPTSVFPRSSVSVTYIGYPSYSYGYSGCYGGYRYPTYYNWGPRGYGYSSPRVYVGHRGVHASFSVGRRR